MRLVRIRYTITVILFFETTIAAIACAESPTPVASAVATAEETHNYIRLVYL